MFADKKDQDLVEKTTDVQDRSFVHSALVKLLFHLVFVLLLTVVVLSVYLFQLQRRVHHLETYLLDLDHRNALAVARNNLDQDLAADLSVQDGEVIKHKENIEPGHLQRLSESQFNSKNGKTKSRDTTQVTETFFHKLTRNVRNVQSTNCKINIHDVLQSYCEDVNKKKVPPKKSVSLESASYEAKFYKIFPYKTLKSKAAGENTFTERELWAPHIAVVNIENIITYPSKDSPLGIFNVSNESAITPLVHVNNWKRGEFTVDKSGLYSVHFNITLIDKLSNTNIGLFVNNRAMLACPPGGFICPSNYFDSSRYRICNIQGVLALRNGDVIVLKTMVPNTIIRLESGKASLLYFVLLSEDKTEQGSS
uniref:TNF family profile domain-containing protein n=1 Tax=Biomphalaria glabrata TaxID=6526 RepID=A0A2C9LLE6_BIOGL